MKHTLLYIAAVLMLMLTSCRMDLCYDHFPSTNIALTWEREWERNYGMNHAQQWDQTLHGISYHDLRPDVPEWVHLIKFRKDGTTDYNFLDIKGGNVKVDNSTDESFLLYNGDTECIVLEDIASQVNARATTTSRNRSRSVLQYLQSLTPGARTVNPPDILYSAFVEELPTVLPHNTYHMPITMQPLVYTYVIRYEFEQGLEHVAMARGALGGMAESVYLRTGVTSDETAILLYDCKLTNYGCEAHVRTFGVPSFPDEYYGREKKSRTAPPVAVNLELRLTNGNYLEFNYDVSDQIENQPRGGVIYIKGITVKKEDNQPNSGFDVGVDDWGDPVDVDLPM